MSAREKWQPGDVALFDPGSHKGVPMVRTHEGRWTGYASEYEFWIDRPFDGLHNQRRAIVVDPENPEQVARLAQQVRCAIEKQCGYLYDADMKAALRSLIADPEPEEPTGIGAYVKTAHGFVVLHDPMLTLPWIDQDGCWRDWRDLPRPLTVLSPGYEAES